MDKHKHIISIVICMFVIFGQVLSQSIHQYNLNQYNGLPSNHVYFSLVDRMGYLWLATDKGVARYNGYELKIFGLADGIPEEDIWHLYEDRKGRIWLSAITSEMGYIYNGKYKKAWIKDQEKGIYPFVVKENNDGIVFLNNDKKEKITSDFCYEQNDSIRTFTINNRSERTILASVTDNGDAYVHKRKAVYKFTREHPLQPLIKICDDTSIYSFDDSVNRRYFAIDNYIITYHTAHGKFHALNLQNCTKKIIPLFTDPTERFITPFERQQLIYIVTNKNVYVFNQEMELINRYADTTLVPGLNSNDKHVLNICIDTLWDNCISVPGNGVYINLGKNYYHQVRNLNLDGYIYTGKSSAGFQYWWNEASKTLQSIDSNWHSSSKKLDNISSIVQIVPFDNKRSLLVTDRHIYYLDGVMNVESLFKNVNHYIMEGNVTLTPKRAKLLISDGGKYSNIISHSENTVFITTNGNGFFKYTIRNDTITSATLSKKGYAYAAYDSVNKTIWNYNKNSIYAYNIQTGKTISISARLLSNLNIDKIEKLLVDGKNGNIYVKSYNKLVMFNYNNRSFHKILHNYKLDGMTPYLYDNKLILAGSPGILIGSITNTGGISQIIFYPNTKKINYQFLHGKSVQFSGNTVLINTDKGAYTIEIPSGNEINQSINNTHKYRVISNYADSVKRIRNGESIYIRQNNYNLKFDVINPAGAGIVKYSKYMPGVDSAWNAINANELHLANLEPGKYYDLYLSIADDIWVSDIIKLKLYIIPKWWQTYFGKKIVAVFIISGILGLAWLIFAITKRTITRKNAEKTMQLELKNLQLALELKSIYAQINPHFIFNSLNTGLLYIKKRKIAEAYTHISAFSGLLRAYIKASRNKFITLKEEIANLKNYILLQEARFKNRFNFEIITDNNIDQEKTIIPSLLLQPLVENAISHGLFHKEETGNLIIEFKKGAQDNQLLCIIDDDGVGRETARQFKQNTRFKTESYGTDLVKDLISIFNRYEAVKIDIDYIDKMPPQTGTTVILTIKYLHDESAEI